jgi:hypothetical protein
MTATAAKRAPLADRKDDLYETPECAVRALLAVETLPSGAVWEYACGPGAIAQILRATGHEVWATDLADYQSPDQDAAGVDFLLERSAPDQIDSIVTNPPFKLGAEFVEHALTLVPRVYMLLRLAFLESERRTAIRESGWLARVHVFKKRLPMMHRAGWKRVIVSRFRVVRLGCPPPRADDHRSDWRRAT